MCDITFTVVVADRGSADIEVKDIAPDILLAAMQKRVDYFKKHKDELHADVGLVDAWATPSF